MLPMIKAKYAAQARGTAFGVAKSGNNQIAIHFEVTEGEHAGEVISYAGTFTDASVEYTIKALRACGWQGDDLAELDNLDEVSAANLLPDAIELVCEPDTYDGDTRLKVKWVNKPGAGRLKFKDELTGHGLKTFAATMKATIRGLGAGGASRPATPPKQNGAPPSRGNQGKHPNAPGADDDIPFATASIDDEPSPIARCLR